MRTLSGESWSSSAPEPDMCCVAGGCPYRCPPPSQISWPRKRESLRLMHSLNGPTIGYYYLCRYSGPTVLRLSLGHGHYATQRRVSMIQSSSEANIGPRTSLNHGPRPMSLHMYGTLGTGLLDGLMLACSRKSHFVDGSLLTYHSITSSDGERLKMQ